MTEKSKPQVSLFPKKTTLNCRGSLLSLEQPLVMGILNITPDSFFKGSRVEQSEALLPKVEKMVAEGATILDLGAASSRPGAAPISEKQELGRLLPALKSVKRNFPDAIISVDTVRSAIAREAINHGASIINDITAGDSDAQMFDTIAAFKVPYIMMHMQGSPATMQDDPNYENVVEEVAQYFAPKVMRLRQLGVTDLVLDPGFGFGKTVEHNYELLDQLDQFSVFGCPLLAGVSRKSMINKVLNTDATEALNGTTVLHAMALERGATILRVHDVKEAVEAVQLFNTLHSVQA